ncbi:MAG TPA: CARDB domain-containing protein, partial [Anaerolineaceae bacterium]|nr:CARDB domain-containing protein [Anaerolineaceae bacterium]
MMKRLAALFLALTFLFALVAPGAASRTADFDCNTVSGIPVVECEALVALYNSTNGPGWTNHTNWLVTNTPSDWYGVIVEGGHVTRLSLFNNLLTGSIPAELGNLSNLQRLYFNNNQLTDSIPPELGSLLNLQYVYFDNNQLTGGIPPELGNLSNLWVLSMSHNLLSGSIPPQLGNLHISELWLSYNQLSGSIPWQLGNLSSLQRLNLGYNQLTGSLPSQLGNLSNLQELYVESNPLAGSIPLTFINLINLDRFYFFDTDLCEPADPEFQAWKATVPYWFGTDIICEAFCQDNVTEIPVAECEALMALYNSTNGPGWTNHTNWLATYTPSNWYGVTVDGGHVVQLRLSANNLAGTIPPELGNLAQIWALHLDQNDLSGPIPSSLGSLVNLLELSLYSNQLSGSIPPELGNLTSLLSLELWDNQLSGSIPPDLGSLQNLLSLHMDMNQLSGTLPPELGNLFSLQQLGVAINQLTGAIPMTYIQLTSLTQFNFHTTQLCEPADPEFQAWKATVLYWYGTGLFCEETLEIHGRVADSSGGGIAGVTLSAGDGLTATTGTDGSYVLTVNDAGTYTVTPSKPGFSFSPAARTVTLPPTAWNVDFTGTDGTLPPDPDDPPPPPEPGKPYISSVSPCIGGSFYFQPWGAPVTNTYTAAVDWQGLTPGEGWFTLNQVTVTVPPSGNTLTHAYNLGNDFNFSLLGSRNQLSVEAVDAEGVVSPPFTLQPIGVEFPAWLPYSSMTIIAPVGCTRAPMRAEGEIAYPTPAFKADITPPDWFPLLGGETFGIRETQAGVSFELEGSGEGEAAVFGQTGFQAAGDEVIGRIYGGGEGVILPDEGIRLDQTALGLEISGKIEAEEPVVELICNAFTGGTCSLEELEAAPVIGGLVRFFNQVVVVKGTIEPALDLGLHFRSQANNLVWQGGTAEGSVRATLALVIELIEDTLSGEVYGGGEPSLTVQVPANPSYLKEVAADLFAGLKLKVLGFERTFEATYGWQYPEDLAGGERLLLDSGWQPETRPAVASNFQGLLLQSMPLQRNTITSDDPVCGAYSEAHPAMAMNDGGKLLLALVNDNPGKPPLQGKEITYLTFQNEMWYTPDPLTDDNLMDLSPQVAVDANDNFLLVWERNTTIQPDGVELGSEYTNGFEIAWSAWDGDSMGNINLLTENNSFDHALRLARGQDGHVLLLWRQNSAGELMGTSDHPDILLTSVWDDSTWSEPVPALEPAANVLGITAARLDSNTQAIVYSQDMDGDLSTDADRELFLLTWQESAWSAPIRLTNDAEPDHHPTLLYHPQNGTPRLFWRKGDAMVALLDSLAGTPRLVVEESSAAILDYTLAQDESGSLALAWQGISGTGMDLFTAAFDETTQVFSQVGQLTGDSDLEKQAEAIFVPGGELWMTYVNVTTTVGNMVGMDGRIHPNVPIQDIFQVHLLRHSPGVDLAITAADLSITPANPAPYETAELSVGLHNLSDRSVEQAAVALYEGVPGGGGILIGTVATTEPLPGYGQAVLTIPYTIPPNGWPLEIYAVADPLGAVEEQDETNNQAFFNVSLPDIQSVRLEIQPGQNGEILLAPTFENAGVSASHITQATFRLDDPKNGTLIGTMTLPALAPTEVYTPNLPFSWDASAVPDGAHKVYVIADEQAVVPELDRTNNTAWGAVLLVPDLSLRVQHVRTWLLPDGTLRVDVWVTNAGERAADGALLGVYRTIPSSGSNPYLSTRLDIPAGEDIAASFNLGLAENVRGFHLGVGWEPGTADADWSNNSLLFGTPE